MWIHLSHVGKSLNDVSKCVAAILYYFCDLWFCTSLWQSVPIVTVLVHPSVDLKRFVALFCVCSGHDCTKLWSTFGRRVSQ